MVKLRFGISLKSILNNYNKERANLNMVKKVQTTKYLKMKNG